jgi:hypothetical protein
LAGLCCKVWVTKKRKNDYLSNPKNRIRMTSQPEISKESSLLVKIINKVDAMSKDEQHALWLRLNQKELLERAKALDAGIKPSELTEDEIVALC